MDLNTLRGLSTVFVMVAFAGICWWAFSPKRKNKFEDAANLPFADEVNSKDTELHPENDEERQG
ncbi:cbb3-type cytochrome c oxidase subunit 3 [Teredinibacter sp. KSP-S5-2]|uniref:cbb3-type cytochrome oxidase subunit 3 n=1 Tax=Teredinibacter sp. KSP-S5-2 TaxID=3034506 RepID=UPI0029341D5D|nr:cbb3-type cytochrome c oxidase subunit 3 [Teredinibacter sp. KSP-S5-2]WNO10200.1 cbb3-type cytochrome c oxidase subunit 3 [Teredinibacter sp. KSP-S5-2]